MMRTKNIRAALLSGLMIALLGACDGDNLVTGEALLPTLQLSSSEHKPQTQLDLNEHEPTVDAQQTSLDAMENDSDVDSEIDALEERIAAQYGMQKSTANKRRKQCVSQLKSAQDGSKTNYRLKTTGNDTNMTLAFANYGQIDQEVWVRQVGAGAGKFVWHGVIPANGRGSMVFTPTFSYNGLLYDRIVEYDFEVSVWSWGTVSKLLNGPTIPGDFGVYARAYSTDCYEQYKTEVLPILMNHRESRVVYGRYIAATLSGKFTVNVSPSNNAYNDSKPKIFLCSDVQSDLQLRGGGSIGAFRVGINMERGNHLDMLLHTMQGVCNAHVTYIAPE
jgi:hypothetical protein